MRQQNKESSFDGWRPSRSEVNLWLKEQPLGVLSTLDETGAPHGSTVAFSVTEYGDILIGTRDDSRKSEYIDRDNRVAFTVTDSERRITVQLQGIARKIAQTAFELDYAKEHYYQRPQSLPFKDDAGQCHILVTPLSLYLSDCQPKEWVVSKFIDS